MTALVLVVGVPSATAVHDLGLFELDENATDNLTTALLGELNGNVTVGDTTIDVQEESPSPAPGTPFEILIDEEQMTVTDRTGGPSTWTYEVTRPSPAAHANNSPVTLLEPGAVPGDDWDTLVEGGGNADVFAFVEDGIGEADPDAFTGGQTKDTVDVDEWFWVPDGPDTDKNDIEHAFAASYVNPVNDHVIIYFGADRFTNDGAAALGFWFLKRPVEQKTVDGENIFVYEGTNTPAEHSDGDLLVQSDFTTGGEVSRIQAYGWNTPFGVAVSPSQGDLKRIATGADCDVAVAGDPFCAQANTHTVPAPWDYEFKGSGTLTSFPTATFFEGGIDATAFFGEGFCVAQLLAETRQSPSETAVLEDKVLTEFELCDIDVDKSGPEKSKVGDDATYIVEVTNSGSVPLYKESIEDSLVGDLTDGTNPAIVSSDCGDSLASGDSCTITYEYTVQPGDDDPLENTVDVVYNSLDDLTGDSVTDSSSHSVNLFQPAITIDKECTNLSKIGDRVDCTVDIDNTSSADAPNLVIESISDTVQGDLTAAANVDSSDCGASLASGAGCTITYHYTVPANATDPYPNTVTVETHPDGFTNDIDASDSDSVNLFQPEIEITKVADNEFSKAGDSVTYTVTIENKSSADTPDLVIESISDTLQGDLTDPAKVDSSDCGSSLVSGASCTIVYTRTVLASDDDPLPNTVTVKTHPDGFGNDIDDSDSASVDLLHPDYTVTKVCKAGTEPVPQEGPAVFTITIKNTGDADLVITADDGIGTIDLAAGATQTFSHSVAGPFSGQAKVSNTVTTDAVLAAKYGLPNTYHKEASGDCRVGSRVNVVKTTQGGSAPVGGWTFKLYTGPDGFDSGTELATDNTPPDTLDFGNLNLDPTKTYTVCEENVPAGWTSQWKVDTDGDGTADTIINPYNPNADDNPAADLGNRCIDFGAGTDFPLEAGGTLVFQVDNSFPGGEPRTPGYWKNWSSCTGGGQYANAVAKGGGAAGYWTLDELLTNPGFTIGLMVLNGVWNDDPFKLDTPLHNDCREAVRILDKSDAKDGKKRASDAAYELATALFAAKLNLAAGAETCAAVQTAVNDGQALLVSIGFTGTGSYLPSSVKNGLAVKRAQALALATTLDNYNNGNLCTP